MFKHFVLPLDGSHLAEAALPAAAYLSLKLGARVTLTHIIERDAPKEVHGERHLAQPEEAHAYLEEIARKAFSASVHVECHVHTIESSDVSRSIVEHVQELTPDLIIMCTHGRGGLRDLFFGSIAQQVVGLGSTPVLLVRPLENGGAPAFACHTILVPLDGIPDHEQGLCLAVPLARACAADMHLLVVVPTPGTLTGQQAVTRRLLPGATREMLDISEEGASNYLRDCMASMQAQDISVTGEVRRGEPADTIMETARRMNADMVVLTTHGKVGLDAFWSGSIAPKVSRWFTIPLLLVPVCKGGKSEE
jgi:nucleotide-binding universal stress UspA family protein